MLSVLNIIHNHSLAPLTSWRVGGIARTYFRPRDLSELILFLKSLPNKEPIFWLGLGSNVLIRDGGFDGTVIHMHRFDDSINIIKETDSHIYLRVGAGVSCAKIAKLSEKHSLAQAHFFSGIPGTMGGALAMNAGAFGGETWPIVSFCEILTRNGSVKTIYPQDCEIGYRTLKYPLKDFAFVSGTLKLEKQDLKGTSDQVKQLLKKRNLTQPIGQNSCGSVFRNPEGDFAARLIESSKLKGLRIGGAIVSSKHSNFIINDKNAKAVEIEALISHLQKVVWDEHGVLLQPEVKFIGSC